MREFLVQTTRMSESEEPFNLDFTKPGAPPALSEAEQKKVNADALVGTSNLKTTGFYVVSSKIQVSAPTRTPVILIIDDDESVREVLDVFLTEEGYQPRLAGNRDEILREIKREPSPDLILCDVEMPDVNGFDLLNKIAQHQKLRKIPVVMLTGRSNRNDVKLGLTLGAAGYITKPARLEVVAEALRKLLR